MQGFANTIFQGFLRELARSTPKRYFNSKRVIQSSVGMIFRVYGGPGKGFTVSDGGKERLNF